MELPDLTTKNTGYSDKWWRIFLEFFFFFFSIKYVPNTTWWSYDKGLLSSATPPSLSFGRERSWGKEGPLGWFAFFRGGSVERKPGSHLWSLLFSSPWGWGEVWFGSSGCSWQPSKISKHSSNWANGEGSGIGEELFHSSLLKVLLSMSSSQCIRLKVINLLWVWFGARSPGDAETTTLHWEMGGRSPHLLHFLFSLSSPQWRAGWCHLLGKTPGSHLAPVAKGVLDTVAVSALALELDNLGFYPGSVF